MSTNMKKLLTILAIGGSVATALAIVSATTPKTLRVDYRRIAFEQNELILLQEEKIEELATVIQTTMPAYRTDYREIDSVNLILDSLYTATRQETE